jgi:putative endonuclease
VAYPSQNLERLFVPATAANTMDDDTPFLLFELARRAQTARLQGRLRTRGMWRTSARDTDISSHHDDGLPRLSPTQRRGTDYEERALDLLAHAGLRPLARNLRCRAGEIDLAMRDGETLVLVEVRARSGGHFGGAAASIDRMKQARLIRAAHCVLPRLTARHWMGRAPRVRFDVVAFEGGTPVWLKHAFEAPVSL